MPHPHTPTTSPARASGISPDEHIPWCAAVARGVARAYRYGRGSQEEADLVQTAVLTLLRCCVAFEVERVPAGGDPGGQLRGYAHRFVQSECRREAKRLKGGGTFHTHRPTDAAGRAVVVIAEPISSMEGESPDDPFDVTDHRGAGGADPPPVLLGTRRRWGRSL